MDVRVSKALPEIEGMMNAEGLKIAILAARFNNFIVDHLIAGAYDFLHRHGARDEDLTLIRVPGAFEMPLAFQKLAESKKYSGVLALGAVIRGGTPHFDYVAAEATKGLATVSLKTGVPIGFGLLTCDTVEQAVDRAGVKSGNKGAEAASALVESIRVLEQI